MSVIPKILVAMLAATTVSAVAPAFADEEHHDFKHYEWHQERKLYGNHWHEIRQEKRSAYDAELKQAWLAYHHNHWKGAYNWDMYNNPGFFEYLHGSNPSLLTRLRVDLGF